ncbi:hypothetical protein QJQ45_009985 [Haematococcus lacustris]|nr:hypothetical protein QJQ45_009985 [Haematococcus lacustris]
MCLERPAPLLVEQQQSTSDLDRCMVGHRPCNPRFASAASTAVEVVKALDRWAHDYDVHKLSLTPSNKIVYNEVNHERFEPGTEGRPIAYFVRTGGRFLWASSIRLAVIKALVTLSAAADTLALGSLEVDLSGVEEGSTITVKWRGKPVFIQHRTAEQIESAAQVPLTDLKDPQKDSERTVDPKYLIVVGVCTHLGCVPIAGAGNYGGWFCPCHGSHYDGSGRVREGPAPYNLEVPEYRFKDDGKVVIG